MEGAGQTGHEPLDPNSEHRRRRAAVIAARQAARNWLGAHGLMSLAWAAAAGAVATALFGLGTLVRLPCNGLNCNSVAGVPAAILESLGVAFLLVGLAAAGVWIAHLTQRTWSERLRLMRKELELTDRHDTARLRCIDAVLDDEGGVPAIHQQARIYFWAGLPTGVLGIILVPPAIDFFAESAHIAAYMLPVVLIGALGGLAAIVRGLTLAVAARRLTRPLRSDTPVTDAKPPMKDRRRSATEA